MGQGDGAAVINEVKDKEEGLPEFTKVMWGLSMSTLDPEGGHDGPGTITLPEKKLIRLRELFRDVSVSPGTRLVLLHSLQVLRGNGEWMATV